MSTQHKREINFKRAGLLLHCLIVLNILCDKIAQVVITELINVCFTPTLYM